jgi:hypothetical protein
MLPTTARTGLVAADLVLMGYEEPKRDSRTSRIEGGQKDAKRAMCAEYTQNHSKDCGTADDKNC